MMVFLLVSSFILGVVTVVALEAVGIWFLISRFNRKLQTQIETESIASLTDPNPSLHDKQGELWLLEPEKVPKIVPEDKAPAEQKKRKDTLEVTPVLKHARIKDHCLILTETDGPCPEIPLRGCTVVAVSATNLSSRKWAKRYPIKVERKDSVIYRGHKVIYIYLETSWEKESWCKALRLASCTDEEKKLWFSKLSVDFHNYLTSLNAGYPSFMKPYGTLGSELMDKSVKFDNSSSKVRQFIKKLGRKASRNGHEYKSSGVQNHEDRKLSERSRSFQDSVLTNCVVKMGPTGKPPNVFSDDVSVTSSVSTSADTESDYKNFDEGALCFNLLISRFFFDAKNNQQIVRSIQNRIQRTLSNMRIPSYIGGVNCTAMDLGALPPRILAMRVLPSDMNEVLAMEIDVEYLGDAILDIETRLEIQELDLEGNEARLDNNTADEVTSDLLEDFENIGEHLKLSDETLDEVRQKDRDEKETSKSVAGASFQVPKWKSVLHSITKQVSQVPFSLGIKVSSLRGTLRLSMKPPPSDQIWLAFSSMPDIEFNLESHVGDCKITSGHLALFLINKFKAGIRETLVLPNRENITVPWMLAEKDDWVPQKVAPFMWYKSNQDLSTNSMKRVNSSRRTPQVSPEKPKSTGHTPQLTPSPFSLSTVDELTTRNGSFDELRTPLVKNDILTTIGKEDKPDISMSSRSLASSEGQVHSSEDEDTKLRRIGTRERMRGLGKRMGEKLEVKRRHIEEKGRSLVERMREGSMRIN